MIETDFKCSRCGFCCRALLSLKSGVVMGMSLTKEEVDMFDPKYISPCMAIGTDKPSHIIIYQLNRGICPFINEKNECKIYQKRPLVCQSFPIEVTFMGGIVHSECSQSKVLPKDGTAITDAGIKINQYILKNFKEISSKKRKMWYYDLATKKWVVASNPFLKTQY